MNPNITFCLNCCGEETEEECLKSIEHFRDKIVFQEVRNVYPQIKALSQMVSQVKTEYLVPLDADIILNEDAYKRICNALNQGKPHNWHSILFPLYDTLTEQKILALKVMRTDVLKKHSFKESRTPDVEHYQRLLDNGYIAVDKYLRSSPIGKHVVRGKWFCYNKYKDVYLTLRSHQITWDEGAFKGGITVEEKAKNHFNFFLYKWAMTNNEDYLACIAGIRDGLKDPVDNFSKSLKKEEIDIDELHAVHQYYENLFNNSQVIL